MDGIFYNSMSVDVHNGIASHGQNRVEQVRVEHDRVQEMIDDAFGVQDGMEPEQYFDEAPNEELDAFMIIKKGLVIYYVKRVRILLCQLWLD